MKRVLYLPVEIIERELDAKLLLAAEALSRGYRVYLGHFRRIESLAYKEKGGLYLYKAMTDENGRNLFQLLRQSGVGTLALDEEGLVWPSLEYYADTRIGRGLGLSALDLIFTWGEQQREYIVQNYAIDKAKVVTSGSPRFDILKEPYLEIYKKDVERINSEYGRFILVSTNFGPANFSRFFGRTWLEHLISAGVINSEEKLKWYQERENYYKVMLDSYVEAFRRIAKSIYPVKVIVRPHPSEEHSTWLEKLGNDSNIFVAFRGSSKPWIMAAECLVHSGCTSGLEGFVLGTPVIRYNVTGREDMESPLPNEVSEFCATYDDLEYAICLILKDSFSVQNSESKRNHLKIRLRNIDGKSSCRTILDEIEKRFRFDPLSHPVINRRQAHFRFRPWARSIRLNFERKFLESDYLDNYSFKQRLRLRRQRFSGLSEADVYNRLREISKVAGLDIYDSISVEQVAKDVFCIANIGSLAYG